MRSTLIWLAPLVLLMTALTPLGRAADGDSSSNLIEFKNLPVAEFGHPLCVNQLLDVRSRAEYDAAHIEGAIWADLKQAEAIAARPGGLTDRAAWLDWITPLGLQPGHRVWIIGDNRQLDASRAWWLLRYLGVETVGLVNGNFGLWQEQRRPVTQNVPKVEPVVFPIDFQADRLATREQVLEALKSHGDQIVDARSADEWVGKTLRAKRGGHIPDACRLEWTRFVGVEGRFLSVPKLKSLVDAAGIKPGQSLIAHCQSGGRASVDAFVFERLGYPTRTYYLSWADWGNAEDTPITTADTPQVASTPVQAAPVSEAKPFTVEYDYKCKWGLADEFLALFKKNHLPILRERMKAGDILKVSMTKPRIHTAESDRWDFRVTLEFKDAAQAFNIAADEPIKQRLFPDQKAYKVEEQRRFAILEGHTDLPIEAVDLDKPVKAP